MLQLRIVEPEILPQLGTHLRHRIVDSQLDLVLHTTPDALNKDFVHPTTFSFHPDLDIGDLQNTTEGLAGELSSLVRVEDHRSSIAVNVLLL